MRYVLLLLFILWALPAQAVVRNIASCTPAALTTTWNAAQNGDTLQFPSCTGTRNWGTNITLTGSATTKRNLKIKGTGRNTTKLWHTASNAGAMIRFDNVVELQISDLEIEGSQNGCEQIVDYGIHLNEAIDFVVHNARFRHLGMGLRITGNPEVQKGVVYENEFIQNAKFTGGALGYGVFVGGLPNTVYPPLALGTTTNVFIEDNDFWTTRHTVASGGGARYVYRYNTVHTTAFKDCLNTSASYVDAHGYPETGTRQWEVYHNWFKFPRQALRAIGMRGGDGLIWNNYLEKVGTWTGTPRFLELIVESNAPGDGCQEANYPEKRQVMRAHIWGNGGNIAFSEDYVLGSNEPCIQEGRDFYKTQCLTTGADPKCPGYTIVTNTSLPQFPPGMTVSYPQFAPYPHPLRLDPPAFPPSAPTLVMIVPIQ